MRGLQEQDWTQVGEVLRRISGQQGPLCPAASSAGGRASSCCASAETNPKAPESAQSGERDYVQAILDCYLKLPGTASVTSRYDRRCAQALFRRSVPLEVVKNAMVVAVARRTFRRGDPLPRVRALHYFLPVIDELLAVPCEPGYVCYLEGKLQPLAAEKAARQAATPPPREDPSRGS